MIPFLHDAVDLFAGIGGWEVITPGRVMGVENNSAARLTRRAANLRTLQVDVRKIGPALFPRARKLRGSPPCQTFAQSGNGAGVRRLAEVSSLASRMAFREDVDLTQLDERTGLVLEPLRWVLEAIDAGRFFESVALEQVPRVLPFWEVMADILEREGYHVWTGVLNAEQYGVPQARQRAVLLASTEHPVGRPKPTHSLYHRHGDKTRQDPGVLPYVTAAEALGWHEAPSPRTTYSWAWERPATTVVGSFHPEILAAPGYRKAGDPSRQNTPGSVTITLEEALVLQSFPRDWPLSGPTAARWRQVGNAIPPLMAEAIRLEVES